MTLLAPGSRGAAGAALQDEPPGPSASRLADLLRAAISEEDRERVGELLSPLAEGDGANDPAVIALRRGRIGRLLEALGDVADTPGGAYALGRLHEIDAMLDRADTRALGIRARETRDTERATVRDRLLQRLATPARPGELAAELGIDPSQVSRALRQLEREQLVVGRSDSGDRRRRVYERQEAAPHTSRHRRGGDRPSLLVVAEQYGVSLAAVAKESKVSVTTVRRADQGRSSRVTQAKIVRALSRLSKQNLSIDDVFVEKSAGPPQQPHIAKGKRSAA